MKKAVIVSMARTAIGNSGGMLKEISATKLGAIVIKEALKRASLDNNLVDEVIMGTVLPAGLGQNPARQAMLIAGLPVKIAALTINKVCGSGLEAVMDAYCRIVSGKADIIVAGGMENMDLAPYYLLGVRAGYRMGHQQIVDGMIRDGLWDNINDVHMGDTAEMIAEKYGITREETDQFAFNSNRKALEAMADGRFSKEIVPVEVPQRKGEPIIFDRDEGPRETTLEVLAKLKPFFKNFTKNGQVTAGNASKISIGAAAVVVMSEEKAKELGIRPLATIVTQAAAGVDPLDVLVAPIFSIPKALENASLELEDIDLHEINEAFSTSSLAVIKRLGIDPAKVNINGGSVALGHPIGASGARVLVTLLQAMEQRDATYGQASLCLGGGEAVTLIIKREK